MSIIEKLHIILNNIKGFSSCYSYCKNNKMIIQYEGELYLTEFKKINISEEDLLHVSDWNNL